MRFLGRDRDSAAGFLLLFVLMGFIVVFYHVAERVREGIEADHSSVEAFLGDWHSLRSDITALSVLGGIGADRSSLRARLADCDRRLASMAASRVARSMLVMKSIEVDDPDELLTVWERVRSLSARIVESPSLDSAVPPPIPELLSESADFEKRLKVHVAAIDDSARSVRSSLAILQQFFIFAAVGLAAIGAWATVSASRSRREKELLRDLMRANYRAQEAERKRISLELHDTLAQELAAAGLHASCLADDADGHREALRTSLRQAIRQVRELSWDMRPPELERAGLRDAVSEYCRRFEELSGITVSYAAPVPLPELPEEVAINLYRILQEAFANARKYSRARRIAVELRFESSRLTLRIQDDGTGFAPEAVQAGPGHQGIAGMRERAKLIGGVLKIDGYPGKGAVVCVEVSCERN